jgi:UDP-N-acetyl-D-mannosaminuronate dehydrogenase
MSIVSDNLNASKRSFTAQELLRRINTRTARLGVVGLGYVGLLLAMTFKRAGFPVESQSLDSGVLKQCDVALILTDHSQFEIQRITGAAPLIFDTRNATCGVTAEQVVRL